MSHSIDFESVRNETGSAVVGFAIGAPFVLIAFIGFLNLASMAWKGVGAEVRISNLVQQLSFDNQLTSGSVTQMNADDLQVYFSRGSEWGISKVIE
ncbi:MAG: hypothetical protein RLZZ330_115 [Actinomycetota bacterium]|jgi:hypothetical protein